MKQLTLQLALAIVFASAALQFVSCAQQSLEEKYPHSTYIEDNYKIHWNFDLNKQKIDFAVNVTTNGWIGFGISPTGKMLHSDIVIGWVNKDGSAQFHDRFAILSYILPPIDKSQDWTLVNTEQKNGQTVLEFTRDLVTCDDKEDMDIKPGFTKVIYAYHSLGPDNLITLDSLTPEKLGSSTVMLIPEYVDADKFDQLKKKKCDQAVKKEL